MNSKQLNEICKSFELGNPTCPPRRVFGGLLHIMWHVITDKAAYAIKQLSRDIKLKDKAIRRNYELTERIAFRFSQQGIPAISALEKDHKHIIEIDEIGFLIYPWINAHVLDNKSPSEPFALRIAAILANLHLINLEVPEIAEPQLDIYTNDSILELIYKAEAYNCSFARNLRKHEILFAP